MRISIRLEPGQVVRATGPLRARVSYGQVVVLGAVFNHGDEFVVHKHRSYAIKALVESSVEVEVGYGGSLERPEPGEEVVDTWLRSVDDAIRRGCKSFMVLGPVDAGKSSLSAMILNRALLRGMRAGVVDADVGQADVGPPACVSAAEARRPLLWLRELRAEYIRFVGSITPQRAERRIVAGAVELALRLRSRGIEVVVVDTDGWVQGINSIEYKAEIARYIPVDMVYVVGDEKLYHMVERLFSGQRCGVAYLPSPASRRERSREERRELRSQAYRRYLEPLYERDIDLARVSVYGSCFFSGARLPGEHVKTLQQLLRAPVLAASETHDTLYVVTLGQADPGGIERAASVYQKQMYILDKNLAINALVSLIGPDGEEKALGLLRDIDFQRMVARVATPYTGEVKGLVLGGVRLSEDYEETGRPLRCVI
ncbi:hypothetical protein CF15_02535 [Pyrodictium occultum]|uniref:polynucleotide 5'-hydroxyl-kinase n=1 Tax=Pyrodictium occultum TaxID=2309 RepID=A0A0V8RUH3_PYROC|nr:Clp1/GlmU family protein [Pyrodictium occultum]KSW11713.1 hypothetical protein CF15_02535 [Pyrodictium occultum]